LGKDVTEAFIKGARESLKLAQLTGATTAILKNKSPHAALIPHIVKQILDTV